MTWLALLLLLIFAAPFARERCKPRMTSARRAGAPGEVAPLARGATHYQMRGPADGPLVVLVHGLTTPGFVWGAVAEALTTRGYRVLVYDLYGRGYSDRPAGHQDSAFFIAQLQDLLAYLDVDEPFHLVGYSMGGAIAAAFAAAHPARVERLALIASAGLHQPDGAMIHFVRARGLLGDWLMLALYPAMLRKGIRAERELISAVPGIADLQQEQLRFRGFLPAVISSLRGILARPLEDAHRALQRNGLPVLALWGETDDLIPQSAMTQLRTWNRHAVQEVIPGAGHGVTYTHAERVSDMLLGFLPRPAP